MQIVDTDVLISGGGIAGLTAACAFGAAGFRVICVDPAVPPKDPRSAGNDLRTTALLQPAQALLVACGLWDRLQGFAAPLQIMRIVDAGGASASVRQVADFDAGDISTRPFGWNLPNRVLRREMLARINQLAEVTFCGGVTTLGVISRDSEARVSLSNGTLVLAKLLIAADGRHSPLRQAAGIGVKTWRYGQQALVFSVTHPKAHQNVSTEIHRTGGPFTLVPLPDLNGRPCSSVVWMDKEPAIQSLAALNVSDLEIAANDRSCKVFGPLKLVGPRAVFPIISQLANRMSAERTAFIGESAHVVPPIGAQGLNMGLADLSALLELANKNPAALGDFDMLSRYHRRRWPDVKARVTGIDLLNRASMFESPALRDLRRKGLKILHGAAPLRKTLMRAGLGAGG